MNEQQRKVLLKAARDAVTAVITGKQAPKVEADDPALTAKCGCFVTLKSHGQLRGCIGQFISDKPLVELVVEMAKASATGDPRFLANPILSEELPELDIEISVLSALKRTSEPLSLRLGIDGIYIKKGSTAGCFLPQVATETGWSKEEFLSHCCSHKAGLAPEAWKEAETEVYLFTAEVFGGPLREV